MKWLYLFNGICLLGLMCLSLYFLLRMPEVKFVVLTFVFATSSAHSLISFQQEHQKGKQWNKHFRKGI